MIGFLLVTFWFITPLFNVWDRGPCEGAVDSIGADVEVRMFACEQSSTWRDSSAAMIGDPQAFARLWPIVRGEARERLVRSRMIPPDRVDSMTVPAGAGLAAWLVVHKPWSGRSSCPSRRYQLVPPTSRPRMTFDELVLEQPVTIGPSPASTHLDLALAGGAGDAEIEIFDIAGRLYFSRHYPAALRWRRRVDVSSWPQGIYFVRVRQGAQVTTRRVVVAR